MDIYSLCHGEIDENELFFFLQNDEEMPSDVASLWTAPLVMRKTDNRVSVLGEHNTTETGTLFWQPFSLLGQVITLSLILYP